MIPASRSFSKDSVPALAKGKMDIVRENTRMFEGLCAVNSLGIGGYHVHTLLMANEKIRSIHYMASQQVRLCIYQSRTIEGLCKALQV